MDTKQRTYLLFVLLSAITFDIYGQSLERWIIKKDGQKLDAISKGKQIKHLQGGLEVWEIPPEVRRSLQQGSEEANDILLIEPDQQYFALNDPNDPFFNVQWAWKNIGQTGGSPGKDIQALRGWEIETGNDSIVIGVLDSGIDWQHPDLIDNIWQNLKEDADKDGRVLEWNGNSWIFDPGDQNGIDDDNNGYVDDFIGWDFVNDDNNPMDDHTWGHGTHVSGIMAAKGNNGEGIAGLAWNAKLMSLKILNENGAGYASNAVEALYYALNMGVKVSNNSWGGGFFSDLLSEALDSAQNQGHMFVAASGNNYGNNNDEAPLYPASYLHENIISVSASDHKDLISPFTNVGANSVDIFAPGFAIYSTLPEGKYGYFSGTSMAAPVVSGAIALLLSTNPQLRGEEIRKKLIQSVDKIPSMALKCRSGGRINIARLLDNSCDVNAYFEIGNVFQCKGDTILVPNLSTNATSFRWFLNGKWISDQFSPRVVLAIDDDDNTEIQMLELVAYGENCTDTFQQELSLVSQPLLRAIDTTHCGEIITLQPPIHSPFFQYTWYDSTGTVLGNSQSIDIRDSGSYRLEIVYQCQSNVPIIEIEEDDDDDETEDDDDDTDDDDDDTDDDDDDTDDNEGMNDNDQEDDSSDEGDDSNQDDNDGEDETDNQHATTQKRVLNNGLSPHSDQSTQYPNLRNNAHLGQTYNNLSGNIDYRFEIPVIVKLLKNCIWPGDANADGTVSMVDYLITGLIDGETGPERRDASPEFIPQQGLAWSGSFPPENEFGNGANYMHVDGNGDGIILLSEERSVIRKHFNKQTLPKQNRSGLTEVNLELENGITKIGDTTNFSITLKPVGQGELDSVVGVALRLEYDFPLNTPIAFDPTDTWFWVPGMTDTLVITDQGKRSVNVGLLRKEIVQSPTQTFGPLLKGRIIVIVDDIGDISSLTQKAFISISITEIVLMKQDGRKVPLNLLSSINTQTLIVDLEDSQTSTHVHSFKDHYSVNIWPNPLQDRLNIKWNNTGGRILNVEVLNTQGKILLKKSLPSTDSLSPLYVNLCTLKQGFYWIKFDDGQQTIVYPIQKL